MDRTRIESVERETDERRVYTQGMARLKYRYWNWHDEPNGERVRTLLREIRLAKWEDR